VMVRVLGVESLVGLLLVLTVHLLAFLVMPRYWGQLLLEPEFVLQVAGAGLLFLVRFVIYL
jgi:hypothetical protein